MQTRVGISGWTYPPWRGDFYPAKLPHSRELAYAASKLNSIEINGSFYALQLPTSYRRWRSEVPDDFVFTLKGARFITHMKRLTDSEHTLPNFFASGVLTLQDKLGPVLWQLPPNFSYDRVRIEAFLQHLPRSTAEAAYLARKHDDRLTGRAWTGSAHDYPMRHALEVRHASFVNNDFLDLLRQYCVAAVIADTAGKWPQFDTVTADFVYLRLHGASELYVSGYTEDELARWARRIEQWQQQGVDAFVYFDNDVKVRSPYDAMRLTALLSQPASALR